jgi:hypothetical protein
MERIQKILVTRQKEQTPVRLPTRRWVGNIIIYLIVRGYGGLLDLGRDRDCLLEDLVNTGMSLWVP